MNLLAIDPGPGVCGVVVYCTKFKRVLFAGDVVPGQVLSWVYERMVTAGGNTFVVDSVCCENIVAMGIAVGETVFQTCKVIGRLMEAYNPRNSIFYLEDGDMPLVSRRDVKTILAGGSTYPDPKTGARKTVHDGVVKRIVKSRFPETGGGKDRVIGVKSDPGPLWIMKGTDHAWQALAVALAYLEMVDD